VTPPRLWLAAAAKDALLAAGHYARRLSQRPAPALTALMFHRVLPATDPQRQASFDEYVLTPAQFAAALNVAARLFQVVPLDRVLDHLAGGPALPPRAALLTFDDGWRDTLEVAAPILQQRGLPAVVFVPPLAVGHALPFWQERLLLAARTGAAAPATLATLAQGLGLPATATPEALAGRLTDLPRARRAPLALPEAEDRHPPHAHRRGAAPPARAGHRHRRSWARPRGPHHGGRPRRPPARKPRPPGGPHRP
jgi:hypothetical protein